MTPLHPLRSLEGKQSRNTFIFNIILEYILSLCELNHDVLRV